MDQTEFQRALKKFEKGKARRALASPQAIAEGSKVNTALPWTEIQPKPPKVKHVEQPRPRPKDIEISVSGPLEFKFSIDWSGTLLGGQINKDALLTLFKKYLTPMGRVK
jgi:hypothetical protein